MHVAKQTNATQVAKWAAIFTLVVAVACPALQFALDRLYPRDGEPTVLYIVVGVCSGLLGLAALGACFVACIACVVNRLKKESRATDDHAA
jgi:hypothetical protein